MRSDKLIGESVNIVVVHCGVDWDWEMPALTLVALVLAGLLIAAGDEGRTGADAGAVGAAMPRSQPVAA